MKKRFLAILLSTVMMFSGAGTAFAKDGEAFLENENEEIALEAEFLEEEIQEAQLEESIEDIKEASEEEVSLEEVEAEETEAEADAETLAEEDAAELSEDTVYPTGLKLDDNRYEIIRGENYDEAAFQGTYPAKYINENLPALRDQAPYGTCWAFASIALAEINLMQSGIMPDPDLSELHLAYFAFNSAVDPLGGTQGDYILS